MTSGTGTCSVKYDQAGNTNYNAAPQVTESVNAQKADQAITVTHARAGERRLQHGLHRRGDRRRLGQPGHVLEQRACSNTGATFTMTSGTGTCSVKYDQAGDANYNAAPQVTETVNAQKADQTINVTTHAPASRRLQHELRRRGDRARAARSPSRARAPARTSARRSR